MNLLMLKPARDRLNRPEFQFIRWVFSRPLTGTELNIIEIALLDTNDIEYPTVAMTSDTTPAPLVASASSFYLNSTYRPFKAFDKNLNWGTSTWATREGINCWIQLKLPTVGGLKGCKIKILNSGQAPESFTVKSSNTGAFTGEEITLYESGNLTWTVIQEYRTFLFGGA